MFKGRTRVISPSKRSVKRPLCRWHVGSRQPWFCWDHLPTGVPFAPSQPIAHQSCTMCAVHTYDR